MGILHRLGENFIFCTGGSSYCQLLEQVGVLVSVAGGAVAAWIWKGSYKLWAQGTNCWGDQCEQTKCQLLESDLGCSSPWPVVPATGASGVFYSQPWGWSGIFSQTSFWGGPEWVRRVRALHHQLEQGHGLQSVCLLPAAQGTEWLYHPQTYCVCLFNSKL